MEMLVSSLRDIKSTELVIVRNACSCGIRNEVVVLCDSSDRDNHQIICPVCKREFEIDMKPVFLVGVGDWDWESTDNTTKSLTDEEILNLVKGVNNQFKVI